MAQSGFTPIQTYRSVTAAAVPLAANLVAGELAINTTDGKMYFKNTGGAVTALASATALTDPVISSLNGGQLAGLRNRVINGDMRIAQRGTSGTFTSGQYTTDRWFAFSTGTTPGWSVFDGGISALGIYSTSIFQITGSNGNTDAALFQRIESKNCRDLAGKIITVSYLVFHNKGTSVNFGVQAAYAGAVDNFNASSVIFYSSVNQPVSSGVWTKVVATISVPLEAVTGIQVGLSSNTNYQNSQFVYITQVQLELGSVATPFEQRPIGLELSLCQRYYETGRLTVAGDGAIRFLNVASTFNVAKRAVPTVVSFDDVGNPNACSADAINNIPVVASSIDPYSFRAQINNVAVALNSVAYFNYRATSEL